MTQWVNQLKGWSSMGGKATQLNSTLSFSEHEAEVAKEEELLP